MRADFIKTFKRIAASGHEEYNVWSAFVTIFSLEIASAFNDLGDMAEEYQAKRKKFEAHAEDLASMYNDIVEEFERDTNQDLLGSIYMELGISSKDKGQFFTPYNLSRMTAGLSTSREGIEKAIEEKGFATFNDPAVGGGAMLIGCYNVMRDMGFNPQTQGWFVAQDVSTETALMCYLQMAILGMPGYVRIGDTLMNETRLQLALQMNFIEPLWTARFMQGKVPC